MALVVVTVLGAPLLVSYWLAGRGLLDGTLFHQSLMQSGWYGCYLIASMAFGVLLAATDGLLYVLAVDDAPPRRASGVLLWAVVVTVLAGVNLPCFVALAIPMFRGYFPLVP